MKKIILKSALLLFVSAAVISCVSDDDTDNLGPNYLQENFFEGYLINSGFNQKVTSDIDLGDYEFGLEFKPLVAGYITSLRVQLPEANPLLRITIWDKVAGTKIKTVILNVAASNTVYNVDIEDLVLVKDKEYAITMNSNDWYNREKTDGSEATYPITVGNIQINTYIWNDGSAQDYPTRTSKSYYSGDLSFNFLQR
ncbi:MAG: hypothetical protein ABI295_01905 [Xanthomarina sp.]